uniref:Uncharacterized protein n=1 Tax=Anguilla anguilla TaxID=7936 RepID=A0A0E9QCR7_ANGAN
MLAHYNLVTNKTKINILVSYHTETPHRLVIGNKPGRPWSEGTNSSY